MADYPLLFRMTHLVRCEKFEALVVTDGRALMAFEDEEWWCHGVDPGGLTESGEGPLVAFQRFRKAFHDVLDDLAAECRDFEDFERDARMFFSTDPTEQTRWQDALGNVREGVALDKPFQGMPRMAPRPSIMQIDMLNEFADAPMTAVKDEETIALPNAA